jgi:triacylglycerol lipase
MLSRLQRTSTLSMLASALLWLLACFALAAPSWVYVGALVIVMARPIVLAIEFILIWFVHGDDPVPRASGPALVKAWLAESWVSPRTFNLHQPFFSHRYPDSVSAVGATSSDVVVLVHGFVCNRGLWLPVLAKLEALRIPFIAVNLEPVLADSIDQYIPIVEEAVQRACEATGRPPVMVGHSMGGLAIRAWLRWRRARAPQTSDEEIVKRVITIGSPHRGTWLARYARASNAHQMRLASPWLGELDGSAQTAAYQGFTCFYSDCDNIVMPCSTATLPGADNRLLQGTAHMGLAFREEVLEDIVRWARAPVKPLP